MAGLQPNVFLIGPTGVGKTTLGARLAQATGREFLDSDNVLCERAGVSIEEMFECEGEEGFRRRERQLIEELTSQRNIVLATGAGAVLDADNRRVLESRGSVIYLRASPQTQWKNLHRDQSRPLLQTEDPMAVLKRQQVERTPLYRELSDHVIDMDQLTLAQACEDMQHWLRGSFDWS